MRLKDIQVLLLPRNKKELAEEKAKLQIHTQNKAHGIPTLNFDNETKMADWSPAPESYPLFKLSVKQAASVLSEPKVTRNRRRTNGRFRGNHTP